MASKASSKKASTEKAPAKAQAKAPAKAASKAPVKTKGKQPDKKPSVFRRILTYFHEVRLEIKRTTWPTKNEIINMTIIVIAALLFFGVLIFLLDWVMTNLLVLYSQLKVGADPAAAADAAAAAAGAIDPSAAGDPAAASDPSAAGDPAAAGE